MVSTRLYRRGPRTSIADIPIGIGNEEQFAAWNGQDCKAFAANPRFYDAAVSQHHAQLMCAADIGRDDRVLDIGCGTGQCTREAARCADRGSAVGIDLSLPLLDVAQATTRSEGPANAIYLHADAQIHLFPAGTFDVALSRFGTMFFADQEGAFATIRRALRPGARLVAVSWRSAAANEWISALGRALLPDSPAPPDTGSVPGPFRHADAANVRQILCAAGYEDIVISGHDLQMYLGNSVEEAFAELAPLFAWMVEDLPPAAASRAFSRMRAVLGAHLSIDGVVFGSAIWLITARTSR